MRLSHLYAECVSNNAPLMATASPDCPGSWRPCPGLLPGDPVRCEVCGSPVHATVPSMLEETPDSWMSSRLGRLVLHLSDDGA